MNLPLTPIRCLYRGVDLYGRKEGVICGSHRFTYSQFGERCERLAAGLLGINVKAGDRVAFLSFNTHQLLEGYYGPPLIRAVSMPLNVRLTFSELVGILNHAEPSVLIFENEFAALVGGLRKKCPAIRYYINTGEAIPQADFGYGDLLSKGRLTRPELRSFDENETAELFYSSGSTGSPKGVMLSHRTLYLHAMAVTGTLSLTDQTVVLHTVPLFHANGWARPQTGVMNGSKQVMVRRFEPSSFLQLIQSEKANTISIVPTMANKLLGCCRLGHFDTSSLKEIIIGGAAASPAGKDSRFCIRRYDLGTHVAFTPHYRVARTILHAVPSPLVPVAVGRSLTLVTSEGPSNPSAPPRPAGTTSSGLCHHFCNFFRAHQCEAVRVTISPVISFSIPYVASAYALCIVLLHALIRNEQVAGSVPAGGSRLKSIAYRPCSLL